MEDLSQSITTALADRYAIEGVAGSGGMAVVYRARDLRHGRQVAVKVLRTHVGESMEIARFRREINIASRLQHPNILPVFDSGEAAGALYYVMPYVDGDSLRARLNAARVLPVTEALAITREVADALAWAHRNGVVHRDIKPENILFSAGHALVADFGVARALDLGWVSSSSVTEAGYGVGTPVYMSPEQAFAEEVDGRTDQYALGCVLYEMLSGAPPFSGLPATAMLLHKTTRDAPAPHTAAPLATHVEQAMLRALAREAADRFPSIEELIAALASPVTASRPSRPVEAPVPSIAVLPFTNNGDADDRFFSDGLTDELIHALGATKRLRVIARTTAFAIEQPGQGNGAALKVDSMLRGSVRRSKDRLRVITNLVDARTGATMWSARYDRQVADVFEIQDEITRAIVEALRVELLAPKQGFGAVADIDAYERYLKARFHWNRRSVTGIQQSVVYLREAVAMDASFAPAFAALAEAHITLAIYGVATPDGAMRDARTAAMAALALEPDMGEALSANACVRALWDRDFAGAAEDFRRATNVSPQYPTAHQWYAMHVLVPRAQFPLAFRQLMRAYELDPLSPSVAVSMGLTHFYARDYRAAAEAFEALIARDPDFAPAHAFLGQVCTELGAPAQAVRHLERAVALDGGGPEWTAAMGVARARAGEEDEARIIVQRLRDTSATRYVSPALLAQVYAALGETANALDALDAAVAVRATDLVWLGVRPVFDSLRQHPRFRAQLGAVGLGAIPTSSM